MQGNQQIQKVKKTKLSTFKDAKNGRNLSTNRVIRQWFEMARSSNFELYSIVFLKILRKKYQCLKSAKKIKFTASKKCQITKYDGKNQNLSQKIYKKKKNRLAGNSREKFKKKNYETK